MDVATITMNPELAKEKLDAWLAEKHVDAAQAREDCIKGYQALADGKVLIDLAAAIRDGGRFDSGFPKLAVARADRPEVYFSWHPNETVAVFDTRPPRTRGRTPATMIRRIDMRRRHGMLHPNQSSK